MSTSMDPMPGSLSFRRIVDVPFETCLAALENWQPTGHGRRLRSGASLLRGPVEHDRESAACRIQVRLARGPLRPLLRMRLDIDRWSSACTVLELIPCGRIRPTAAYFRAGHLLLDSLTRSLPQHVPPAHARDAASQPSVPVGSRHGLSPGAVAVACGGPPSDSGDHAAAGPLPGPSARRARRAEGGWAGSLLLASLARAQGEWRVIADMLLPDRRELALGSAS